MARKMLKNKDFKTLIESCTELTFDELTSVVFELDMTHDWALYKSNCGTHIWEKEAKERFIHGLRELIVIPPFCETLKLELKTGCYPVVELKCIPLKRSEQ